jgi:hypothetical protein
VRSGAFKGAVINGHVRGRYLDDKFFWPILKVPRRSTRRSTSIRPSRRTGIRRLHGFSPLVSDMFGSPGWGWYIETAVHVIRLILGRRLTGFRSCSS